MSKVEIRVRPVIRHVVTRYTAPEPAPSGSNPANGRSSLETLGEFDNEAQAEEVAKCLQEVYLAWQARIHAENHPKPMQYVAVERGFECATNAEYFNLEADALAFVEHASKAGREFRVYAREVTDPMSKACLELEYGVGRPQVPRVPPKVPALTGRYILVPTNGTRAFFPGVAETLEEAKEHQARAEAEYGEPFEIAALLMPDPPPPPPVQCFAPVMP
jgi:hypothetical protein